MIFGISYWVVPIFSGCVWLGMLLGMFLWWIIDTHSAHITPMAANQKIAYISDIGAHKLQPLFITGGTITVISFNLVFMAERWLRHRGKLVPNDSMAQKVLAVCSIIAAWVGGIGLIILTCANDIKHHKVHDTCLVIFIAGYIISAIFICAEYQRLGIHHREHRHLRASFWIKLVFIFVELGLAIAFGALSDKENYNAAAYCEWLVSLIYTFYVWSFAIDFIPVVKYRDGFGHKHEETELEMATAQEQNRNGGYNGAAALENHAYSNGGVANGHGMVSGGDYKSEPVAPSRNF